MITLAREQAEFVLAVLRARIRQIDSLPQYQVIDSAAEQYLAIASEIERQLDNGKRPKGCNCPNWPQAVSFMCPVHGEELAKEEMCSCPPYFAIKECPVHGHEWRKAEEYPPVTPPEAA